VAVVLAATKAVVAMVEAVMVEVMEEGLAVAAMEVGEMEVGRADVAALESAAMAMVEVVDWALATVAASWVVVCQAVERALAARG
jgi:hypothetical protein